MVEGGRVWDSVSWMDVQTSLRLQEKTSWALTLCKNDENKENEDNFLHTRAHTLSLYTYIYIYTLIYK